MLGFGRSHVAAEEAAFASVGLWPTRRWGYVPVAVVTLLCCASLFYYLYRDATALPVMGAPGPYTAWIWRWGVSGVGIAAGNYPSLILHMFAHAGLLHLGMNMLFFWQIGPALVSRFGTPLRGWAGFIIAYFGSGLAGGLMYYVIHPTGEIPMVGASGALCGLLGLFWRCPPFSMAGWMPLLDRRIGVLVKQFVIMNLVLIAVISLPQWLAGQSGGVSWEAHLGGFLFGLFIAPYLVPRLQVLERHGDAA